MYSYTDMISLIFLFSGIMFSIYNLFLFQKIEAKTTLDQSLHYLNFVLLGHTLYVFIIRIGFNHHLFYDYGVPFNLIYGPFFLLIVKSGIYRTTIFSWNCGRLYLHFIPFLIFISAFLILILTTPEFDHYKSIYTKTLYIFSGFHILIYSLFSLYLIFKLKEKGIRREVKNVFFDSLLLLTIVGVLFLGGVSSEGHRIDEERSAGFVSHFFMAFTVLFIHKVWIREFFNKEERIDNGLVQDEREENEIAVLDSSFEGRNKYSKSQQEYVILEQYAQRIEELPDTFFANTELNIETIATELHINSHYLSQTFSLVLQTNYSQYVNNRRLAIAVDIMNGGSHDQESIEGISYLAGFNSKSSFYKSFKEKYEMSPAQFRKKKSQ